MVFAELIRILTARDKELCKEGLDAARYYYILVINVIIVLVDVVVINVILVVISVILVVINVILVAIVQGSGADGWLPGADQSASTAPQ